MQGHALMEVIQLRVFLRMGLILFSTVQEVAAIPHLHQLILHLRPHQHPTKINPKELIYTGTLLRCQEEQSRFQKAPIQIMKL